MLESGVAEAVIGRALVGILEDLVGLVDLFEADFATLVAGIAIGVPLHRELAEGGLQFTVVRRAFDPQNVVIAALGHARVHPRHFRRSVVKSDPVTHGASKTMHPWGFGPRGLVAIENGIAKASPRLGRFLVLLVVVDLGEFRVDDVLVLAAGAFAAGPSAAGPSAAGTTRRGTLLGLLVHGLAELHGGLRQRIGLGRDRRGVAALERFLEVGHRVLDRAPITFADLRAMLGERLFGGMDQRLGVVLRLDLGLALLVLFGVRLRVLDHALDVGLGQAARRLDADLLLLAGAFVLGVHVDDAVGVDIKGHLDLS